MADGVLGVTTSAGEITIIDGWNWYAGTNAGAIGSGQFDFQTVITHEIGHSLAWVTVAYAVSVMFPELSTAAARRGILFADLNTAGEEGGEGLHAEAIFAAGYTQNAAVTGQHSLPLNSTSSTKPIRPTGFCCRDSVAADR